MDKDEKTESSKNKWARFKKDHDVFTEEHEDGSVNDQLDSSSEDVEKEQEIRGELEHPNYKELEKKLTLAEQKEHENWEKVVRITAELDNVRRRAQRDIEQAHRYGLEKLISSLLPVIDSLEQAIQLVDKDGHSAMFEGLQLTMKLFLDTLSKQGVTQLDPTGEVFNPQEHEVMSMIDSPGVAPNSVLTVFQKGYRLADRIIRPARVIIAKANS